MATSTLAAMAPQVQSRLQDPDGIFWNLNFEIYPALAEAVSELLLIVGRPMALFNVPVVLTPNTVWQPMVPGMLCVTNIQSGGSFLKKTVLHSLDYLMASWGPSWESDRAAQAQRWAPLGLGTFIVHPAVTQPVQVQVSGIAYPFTDPWPYSGTDVSVFEKNIDQALQMYAASYCRLKETGQDADEGFELYKRFQQIAQRYTQIQDRRDDLVWTQSFGVPTAPSQTSKR